MIMNIYLWTTLKILTRIILAAVWFSMEVMVLIWLSVQGVLVMRWRSCARPMVSNMTSGGAAQKHRQSTLVFSVMLAGLMAMVSSTSNQC